jgi:CelD/BcsL family acetyltransferase involved in cellulose biosynthesis
MILTERPGFGPVRLRQLQFMGADPNITEIRGMLSRPELELECRRALRAYFARDAPEWDWINWEGLGQSVSDCPHRNGLVTGVDKSTFILTPGPDWDTTKAHLSRNIKESLRKCYNSLRRDGLACTLEVLEEPAAIELGLADFFRLHAERASHTTSVRHANVFASYEARAFLHDVCRRFAERGAARLFLLRVGGRVVAVRVGFQMGTRLYLYYSGWDSAYARYSVMTTLLAEIVKDAIAHGTTSVNLSTGKDVSKTRWRPREVVYHSRVEVAPRASASVYYLGFRAARWVGTGRVARDVLPGFLVRRSEPGPRAQRARRLRK